MLRKRRPDGRGGVGEGNCSCPVFHVGTFQVPGASLSGLTFSDSEAG